eukprot:8504307-Pyramimonas_sp.AAC.1
MLDTLYKHWADLSEKELGKEKQSILPCWGSRGKMPQQHLGQHSRSRSGSPPPTAPIVFDQMA